MRSRGHIAALAVGLLVLSVLSGCSVGPQYNPPKVNLAEKYTGAPRLGTADVRSQPWWSVFGDDQLDALVVQGLADNLETKQAVERINAAELNVVVAGAGGLPSVSISAEGTRSRIDSGTRTSAYRQEAIGGNTQAIWLLDFFGRYRRSTESALAKLDETHALADEARLALLSQVVSAYIDLRYQQRRLVIIRDDLAARREMLSLTQSLYEAGQGTKLDIAQAKGAVSTTALQIPAVEVDVRRATHRIATLLGLPAYSFADRFEKSVRQPAARHKPDIAIPADMIRSRPDIRAAEKRLAGAVADIGVAEAQLYPTITLGGSIAPSYSTIAGLAGSSALTWSFGPTLNLPILDGGRLKANVGIAKSVASEAYLAWRSTVLRAVEEVENAQAAAERDDSIVASAQSAVSSYRQAVNMAVKRYGQGESAFFEVLDVQGLLSAAQIDLAAAIRTKALNYVELNRSIGSGYLFNKESNDDAPVVEKQSGGASRRPVS